MIGSGCDGFQRVLSSSVGGVDCQQITFGAQGVEVERSLREGRGSSILTHEFELQCAEFFKLRVVHHHHGNIACIPRVQFRMPESDIHAQGFKSLAHVVGDMRFQRKRLHILKIVGRESMGIACREIYEV